MVAELGVKTTVMQKVLETHVWANLKELIQRRIA